MAPRKAVKAEKQVEIHRSQDKDDAAVVNRLAAQNAQASAKAPPGRVTAIGRDGKPIWRTASMQTEDPYANAQEYAPEGWAYEWKRNSIHNKTEEAYHSQLMRAGGWSYVTHDRHPGVWGSMTAKGNIVVGDQVLMERPMALHLEAHRDEKRAADERMHRAKTERGLQAASSGVDPNTPAAKANTFVRQAVDPTLAEDMAAARPKYDRDNMSID